MNSRARKPGEDREDARDEVKKKKDKRKKCMIDTATSVDEKFLFTVAAITIIKDNGKKDMESTHLRVLTRKFNSLML